MPSLTLDTSPKPPRGRSSSHSDTNSRSTSPSHAPPFSPITPTLGAARLAASSSNQNHNAPPRQTQNYTYSQPPQTSIPQPPLIPIDFETNPDTLALKSAIAVLLSQKKTATSDIPVLERIKARAMADPEEFLSALGKGEIKTRGDPLFSPGPLQDEEEDDKESEEGDSRRMSGVQGNAGKPSWDPLPTPQTVVRTPPINWAQYGIVGDSLDKLHADQVSRPVEGMPARVGPDGQVVFQGGEGNRRQADLGVAAPYAPARDKIEKMGTRKGGKR